MLGALIQKSIPGRWYSFECAGGGGCALLKGTLIRRAHSFEKMMCLFTINDNVADKITKFASANNTRDVSLLEKVRTKNHKSKIFSYINILSKIYSIQNKFDNLCDLIPKNVDILSVAETKLDLSFPNPQF